MRILYIGTYASWEKVSKGLMPSQHMFGIHQLVDHYETHNGRTRGILNGGYRVASMVSSSSATITFPPYLPMPSGSLCIDVYLKSSWKKMLLYTKALCLEMAISVA